MKKHAGKIILLVLLLISLLCYFLIPSVNDFCNQVFAMFASGDFGTMRKFIAEYGSLAMLISALLMIFQSVVAPLPAFVITITNANLFGWWQGAILSWSSAMAGAAICFWIARILGRDVVERLTSKVGLQQIDKFFERHGQKSILIARLLPFISFDFVSYAAGLTSMRFRPFFIATGLGQLPATIVYSYVGGMLTGGARLLFTGLLVLFALSILVFLLQRVYAERQKRKAAARETTAESTAKATAKATAKE